MQLPIVWRFRGEVAVIVGGGAVGLRRARLVVAAGANVRVVDPALSPVAHLELTQAGVHVLAEPFRPDHLDGAGLVFACTGVAAVNEAVAAAARARGCPFNRADAPEESTFFLPASEHRDGVWISVSTAGLSPAFAKAVLREVAGPAFARFGPAAKLVFALRRRAKALGARLTTEKVRDLLGDGLLDAAAAGRLDQVERLLLRRLGGEYTLAELELEPVEAPRTGGA
jgi:siroheme synthase-like protein